MKNRTKKQDQEGVGVITWKKRYSEGSKGNVVQHNHTKKKNHQFLNLDKSSHHASHSGLCELQSEAWGAVQAEGTMQKSVNVAEAAEGEAGAVRAVEQEHRALVADQAL